MIKAILMLGLCAGSLGLLMTPSYSAGTCTGAGISCLWTNGNPASKTCTGFWEFCTCTDAWCNFLGFAHDAHCGPCRAICGGGTGCGIGDPVPVEPTRP